MKDIIIIGRGAMILSMSAAALLAALPATSQEKVASSKPNMATYITAEEVSAVEKAEPVGDRTIKVIDIGYENFAVGVVHRGRTVKGKSEDRANLKLPPPKPCGRGIEKAPEGGHEGGITHDLQTEGYYVTSGAGTMFTDGYIVNGNNYDLADLNGPTCLGVAYGVTYKKVKKGDVIIIPAGVVHGWIDVPDHVDYITFRPSPGILQSGWTHPAIRR
ncbi:hypothetical protein [Sphingobium nicotianae]|uniref:Cupin type-1 domain-containing protein n=1 Tax=Sphingobium nicotianae TaxID=2782607 RepID=A0A9X1DB63_9SPHN|nr:hypothetical protein [Sphingobium nicotianae]MBT2186543.1 hypothetical protein [Sphingobium nicotianae]